MGLADRDYYKEKIEELEKEENFEIKKKNFWKILALIFAILIFIFLLFRGHF